MKLRLALLAAALTLAGPLPTQQSDTLAPGTRVRLVGRRDSTRILLGEVRRLYRDRLVIYDPVADGEWAVPLDWIGSVKVPRHIALTEPPVRGARLRARSGSALLGRPRGQRPQSRQPPARPVSILSCAVQASAGRAPCGGDGASRTVTTGP